MLWDCWRKLEAPKETHKGTGKTCELRTEDFSVQNLFALRQPCKPVNHSAAGTYRPEWSIVSGLNCSGHFLRSPPKDTDFTEILEHSKTLSSLCVSACYHICCLYVCVLLTWDHLDNSVYCVSWRHSNSAVLLCVCCYWLIALYSTVYYTT